MPKYIQQDATIAWDKNIYHPDNLDHVRLVTQLLNEDKISYESVSLFYKLEQVAKIILLKYPTAYEVMKHHVNNQRFVLEMIKHNGMLLQFVKGFEREIRLEALKQNGLALQYVGKMYMNEDREMILTAVKQNRKALKFAFKRENDHPTN